MVDDGRGLWTLRGKTINLIQQQLPHDRVGSTETCIKAINSGRAPHPGTSLMLIYTNPHFEEMKCNCRHPLLIIWKQPSMALQNQQ